MSVVEVFEKCFKKVSDSVSAAAHGLEADVRPTTEALLLQTFVAQRMS